LQYIGWLKKPAESKQCCGKMYIIIFFSIIIIFFIFFKIICTLSFCTVFCSNGHFCITIVKGLFFLVAPRTARVTEVDSVEIKKFLAHLVWHVIWLERPEHSESARRG